MASEQTINISDLPVQSPVNDTDNLLVEDTTSTKRITAQGLAEYMDNKLGLGEVATEDILPIEKGGTGAITASVARSNLGAGDMFKAIYDPANTGRITAGRMSGTVVGDCATAEGGGTTASGDYSHAEGVDTHATNYGAHAEGGSTTASGNGAHSEGNGTTASGSGAHAEGSGTTASGDYSHAEGINTIASGTYAHAEGGSSTKATEKYSHAEGKGTTANKEAAHAEGDGTTASGSGAHAEGGSTTASGSCSHAEGIYTTANEACSHAEGRSTTASGMDSHAEGSGTTASGQYSHAEGGSATTASGNYAHAEGSGTTASAYAAHSEGSDTRASGYAAHAEGSDTTASGANSHAQGDTCTAAANNSFVGGSDSSSVNTSNTNFTFGTGLYNDISGMALFGEYNRYTGSTDLGYMIVGNGTSSTRSNLLKLQKSTLYGPTYSTAGADYAEYFEWVDGNTNNEDRVGRIVTLNGDKIEFANEDDYILGVISGVASVVGDSYDDGWHKKYLTDVFGRVLTEMVHYPAEYESIDGKKTKTKEARDVEERIVNPEWDRSKDSSYIPRDKRIEWDPVGLIGKLVCIDDGSCIINSFAKPTNGIATYSDIPTKLRVMERIDNTHIRIMICM